MLASDQTPSQMRSGFKYRTENTIILGNKPSDCPVPIPVRDEFKKRLDLDYKKANFLLLSLTYCGIFLYLFNITLLINLSVGSNNKKKSMRQTDKYNCHNELYNKILCIRQFYFSQPSDIFTIICGREGKLWI